ncbi:MAG: hypothetical protein AAF483_11945, partial [Planctomycetota bacterium]
ARSLCKLVVGAVKASALSCGLTERPSQLSVDNMPGIQTASVESASKAGFCTDSFHEVLHIVAVVAEAAKLLCQAMVLCQVRRRLISNSSISMGSQLI